MSDVYSQYFLITLNFRIPRTDTLILMASMFNPAEFEQKDDNQE